MNLQDFFDKDAGISRFDSDEFKEILNFTKELPENYPTDYKGMASDVLSGKNLVSELVNLSTFGEAALYESLFNGKQAYKGIPCAGRNGNILAMPIQLAMNTSCENKDAAWSFMRTLLTEEFQSEITDQFPTNMKVFDAFAQEAMREPTEDDIVKFVYYSVNGNIWRDPTEHEWTAAGKQPKMVAYYVDAMFMPLNTINCYELSENGYETLTRMIDGIDKSISYDVTIITIIAEETGSFFSGQKTVDQVCDAIQSRVNIYVNE
jgi:ABC-type glycerol-3-phosphate transport system substrate-binding protein